MSAAEAPQRYRRGTTKAGDACEVCGSVKFRAADHCHRHGWVRGTLCAMCNHYMSWLDRGKPFTGTEPWLIPRAALLVEHWRKCFECATELPTPTPSFVHQPHALVAEYGFRVAS